MAGSSVSRDKQDNAGVRFPPPFLFLGGILLGWLIDRYVHPFPMHAGGAIHPATLVGLALAMLGGALARWGLRTFRRARTGIIPHHPATQLVQHGPYRYTRNPMYLGLTVAYVGFALLMNDWWTLCLLPVVLVLLWFMAIRREESYLRRAFGEEYEAYCRKVRRFV